MSIITATGLPALQDFHGRKILIVDDDASARAFIRESLGGGYEFLEATNGEAALAAVRDAMPDLILSDVEMPKMNGLELCRILKNNRRFSFIPFILMTAREEPSFKVEGLELGADDYLIKPLNPFELAARVRSMLRIKSLQDQLISANARLQDINEKLHELSMTDTLTGLYNRLFFTKRFAYEFQRSDRYRSALTCIMIDIDHFKLVNDTYGHQAGDTVLKGVSKILTQALRKVDILARYGGEEIVVVLPETGIERGAQVAERLRESVADARYMHEGIEQPLGVTISVGVAAIPNETIRSDDDLLRVADAALYRAKETGRNRIEVGQ